VDHLQKRIDADIGHFAFARLQGCNGGWCLLDPDEFDIDAFSFEIAQLCGQIHHGIGHERWLEVGQDQAEGLARLRQPGAGHQGQARDRSGQSQHH
jgi:hypothetical protein